MPDWKSEVEKRLAVLRIRPAAAPEVVQELVQHLEDRYAELLADGREESAARQAVLAELEGLEHLRVSLPPSKRERPAGDLVSGQPALTYANLGDYMEHRECFQGVAAFTWPQLLTRSGRNGPKRMFGELVTQQLCIAKIRSAPKNLEDWS